VTVERDPNIVLPNDVARCVPSNPCQFASECARAKALIPQFAPIVGGAMPATPNHCPLFLRASEYHRKRSQVAAPPPQAKAWPSWSSFSDSDSEGGEL